MSQPLPPPVPHRAPPNGFTTTMLAVAVGVVLGIVGLIVLAAVLTANGANGTWLILAAIGLVVCVVVAMTSRRRR